MNIFYDVCKFSLGKSYFPGQIFATGETKVKKAFKNQQVKKTCTQRVFSKYLPIIVLIFSSLNAMDVPDSQNDGVELSSNIRMIINIREKVIKREWYEQNWFSKYIDCSSVSELSEAVKTIKEIKLCPQCETYEDIEDLIKASKNAYDAKQRQEDAHSTSIKNGLFYGSSFGMVGGAVAGLLSLPAAPILIPVSGLVVWHLKPYMDKEASIIEEKLEIAREIRKILYRIDRNTQSLQEIINEHT